MSQYYPPPGPFHPPQQNPEEDYYYDDEDEAIYEYEPDDDEYEGSGDSLAQRLLIFVAGGCLVFLCMSCCGLLLGGFYIFGDALLVATPVPGSDIGLSPESPAFPGESVVNEQQVKLSILDVNRDVNLPNIPAAEGREIIIVTIELVNLGEEEAPFNERDFSLVAARGNEQYIPVPGAVDASLGRGSLDAGTGLEGRLVFEVAASPVDLILAWEGGTEADPRYIDLE